MYIKTLNTWVKVRNATTFDRIEAEKLARLNPNYPLMSKEERDTEVGKMIALVLLEQPKISYEDYKKSDDLTMQIILNTVSNEYNMKLAKLAEQHGVNMKAFLLASMGEEALNSLISLSSTTTTSKEPQKSGEE